MAQTISSAVQTSPKLALGKCKPKYNGKLAPPPPGARLIAPTPRPRASLAVGQKISGPAKISALKPTASNQKSTNSNQGAKKSVRIVLSPRCVPPSSISSRMVVNSAQGRYGLGTKPPIVRPISGDGYSLLRNTDQSLLSGTNNNLPSSKSFDSLSAIREDSGCDNLTKLPELPEARHRYDGATGKPVIEVRLVREDHHHHPSAPARKKRYQISKSLEDLEMDLVFSDLNDYFQRDKFRSSFVGENEPAREPCTIRQGSGDVQTLLKHSRDSTEHIYSLPEPLCYGENTIRAVKKITEKYDTLQRQKLHALSFREDTAGISNGSELLNKASMISQDNVGSPINAHEGKSMPLQFPPDTKSPIQVDQSDASKLTQTVTVDFKAIGELSLTELQRIEGFYKSQDTDIVVCGSTAEVSFGASASFAVDEVDYFRRAHRGVPVLVLNKAVTRRQHRRQLRLLLAERNTGFPLWQEKIDYLSNYRQIKIGGDNHFEEKELEEGVAEVSSDSEKGDSFHQMRLSGSLKTVARLRFDSQRAADEFLAGFRQLTADPNDELWKVSCCGGGAEEMRRCEKRRRKRNQQQLKRVKLPPKAQISYPCNFAHVTRIYARDEALVSYLLTLFSNNG